MKTKLLCFSLFIVLISCNKEKVLNGNSVIPDYPSIKLKGKRPNLNISILLDLSDRIDPNLHPNSSMDLYKRDVGYVKSIAQCFEIHIRNKKTIKINDKIQLFIDPEPEAKELNNKIKKLKIHFNRNNAKIDSILRTSRKYEEITESIYLAALKDNSYIGSDIWRFFKNKVNDYCIEEDYRNILIILTDGYLYHKNSKKRVKNRSTYLTHKYIQNNNISIKNIEKKDFGYISSINKLNNLEVLVLGINPFEDDLNEEEVIHKYLEKWFTEMKIERFEIKNTDLPSNTEKIIKNFIFDEKK